MINKKLFVLVAIFLATVILIGFVFFFNKPKSSAPEQKKTVAPFTITGLETEEYGFSTNTQKSITGSIKNFLVADKINTTNIAGKVREGSYSKESVNGGTTVNVLIDIPSIERSYKASLSRDADGYGGLYITCPTPDELIYEPFDCKDDNNG